jgi:type II secretory pathway component PulC
VIAINGQEITKGANFTGLDLKVGDRLTMEIYRNGRKHKVEMTAGPIQ